MRIEIESKMLQAARDRLAVYHPIFRGQPLQAENKSPDASLSNLRVLLSAGLHFSSAFVVKNEGVLITFATGESYLATGFTVGTFEPATKLFALFCSEATSVQLEDWEIFLGEVYEADHEGVIDVHAVPNTADLPQPQLFCGKD